MKHFYLLLVAVFVSLSGYAQQQSVIYPFHAEVSVFKSHKQHNIIETGAKTRVSYEFIPKFHILAHYEESWGIYDSKELKTNFKSNVLAGGIGYTFKYFTSKDYFQARAFVGSSIGKQEWKKTFYSVEVSMIFGKGLAPILSLGFTHNNSRTAGIPNMNNVYGSLGFYL